MANFVFKEVTAVGTASLGPDGSLTQSCMVVTEIQGIKKVGKTLNDLTEFVVPNSVMSGQNEPLIAAWNHIKDILAPQFVTESYSDL
jgi:hypothetical protein